MVERKQDLIIVEDTPKDLNKVMTDFDPTLKDVALDQQQMQELKDALKRLAEHPFNDPDGGTRALYGNHFFPLRRTLVTAVASAVALGAGVVGAVAAPVAGGVALVSTVLLTVQRMSDLFVKLSADEILVYEALQSALLTKKQAGIEKPQASEAEIKDVFKARQQAEPNVNAALQSLGQKGAVASELDGQHLLYRIKS
ncbi:hypothetical protein [Paraburkholderia hospita]|uniref:hypothetical protein n=1 Tax=Paraburkholderia hospita TaxID=169430 RepID=UPI000B346B2D|nr:hypothetical protein [Paraburkholderia hospita]OUL76777.1 hypothetical protein CA603_37285 [Paraburkholderia hospita]